MRSFDALGEKSSHIPNNSEEIHGTSQARRYLQKKKKNTFSGKVYRGARRIRPSLARLRPGTVFVDKAFLSTSTNPTVCEKFMNCSRTGAGAHITLTSKSGVDVKEFFRHTWNQLFGRVCGVKRGGPLSALERAHVSR